MNPEIYNSPFVERWCRGSPLIKLFSEQNKAETWRQLWIWLAESERALGLDSRISEEMLEEMRAQKGNINWERIRGKEKELKHDVMAHIHVYGEVCPTAAGIIHLGVTSCFVQDNADLIIQRQALEHILNGLAVCLDRLANFALKFAAQPAVGRTHFQTASLTTTGKRAAIWADGLLDSFESVKAILAKMRFRGVKGAVGTQDALMELFKGDSAKVRELDAILTKKAGFERAFDICGQTYPRYQDSHILFALSSIGSAAHKIGLDIRLLQADGELAEPFDAEQIGSSAMPYKRNPMRSERICGIGRHLINSLLEPLHTFANQGFERTLDDSANRRIVLPDAFLAADAILAILQNVFEGMQVNAERIGQNVGQWMPSAVLERAMMMLVERGQNRQQVHGRIRQIALGEGGKKAESIAEALPEIRAELLELIGDPIRLCGRAEEQTREFVERRLRPTIEETISGVENAAKKKHLDV